jgi:hypothetical protein
VQAAAAPEPVDFSAVFKHVYGGRPAAETERVNQS